MKFLTEEEANKVRAKLEKDMNKDLDPKEIEYTPKNVKDILREGYELIKHILEHYMDLNEQTRSIVALWTLGTYFHNNYNTYPYLFVNAMRGSGKTRLLKIIEAFANQGQLVNLITEATMFRTTGTLLLDEFEGVTRKGGDTLRELLNSAYKKGTKVFRMKKRKTAEGEEQVVEEFKPFRPIVMANIWGMEEVLGDRCINVLLEKSADKSKTLMVEDFTDMQVIAEIKKKLHEISLVSVVSCICSYEKNIGTKWNIWVKETTYNNIHTHNTQTTQNYIKLQEKEIEARNVEQMLKGNDVSNENYNELFQSIFDTGVDGRYLELFFPMFLLASDIDSETLKNTLEFAKKTVNERKMDESVESKDVAVYRLVAGLEPDKYYQVKELTNILKLIMGEGENDWLNSKWLGRALKRLVVVSKRKRTHHGQLVMLNVEKAIEKVEFFKPDEEVTELKGGMNNNGI